MWAYPHVTSALSEWAAHSCFRYGHMGLSTVSTSRNTSFLLPSRSLRVSHNGSGDLALGNVTSRWLSLFQLRSSSTGCSKRFGASGKDTNAKSETDSSLELLLPRKMLFEALEEKSACPSVSVCNTGERSPLRPPGRPRMEHGSNPRGSTGSEADTRFAVSLHACALAYVLKFSV